MASPLDRWANLPLRRKGLVVVAIPLAALLIAVVLFYVVQRQEQRAEARVARTLEVRAKIQQVHTMLLGEETWVRARVLIDLQGLGAAAPAVRPLQGGFPSNEISRILAQLNDLLSDDPAQLQRLRTVKTLFEDEMAALAYATARSPGERVPSGKALPARFDDFLVRSQIALGEIQLELGYILSEEDRKLAEQTDHLRRARVWTNAALAGGTIFGLGGGILAMLLLTAGIVERVRRSEENARRLAEGLALYPMPGGADEIGQLGRALEETRLLLTQREDALRQAKDQIEAAYRELQSAHAQLAELNRTLEDKVRQQVDEIQRMTRLKRYLSPQVAETVLKGEEMTLFQGYRGEITAVFLDLRGFTAFSDSAEPEEVLEFLRTYHDEMGQIIFKYEGTIERFAGDGMMVFFNAPVPVPDHVERAVRMSLQMQDRVRDLRQGWTRRGYDLDLGIGLAAGFATLGEIGFEGRRDYAAIGNVTNLAARLSAAALGGQILTNQRTLSRVEDLVEAEPLEALTLKGFARPVPVCNILGFKGPH